QGGDLRVHAGGAHLEIAHLRGQVADLPQKAEIGLGVHRAGVFTVPLVEGPLKRIPLRQQLAVDGHQVRQQAGKAAPQVAGIDTGAGQDAVLDKGCEGGGDLEAGAEGAFCHVLLLVVFIAGARASSINSIQWTTGVSPPDCRWAWQPILAVAISAGAPAVSAPSLLSLSWRDRSGWRIE